MPCKSTSFIDEEESRLEFSREFENFPKCPLSERKQDGVKKTILETSSSLKTKSVL